MTISDAKHLNQKWLLNVLSTLSPDHRYFNKDYYPTPQEQRNQEYLEEHRVFVDNADGFFDNLPPNKFKGKKKSKLFKSEEDAQKPFKFNVKNFKLMKSMLQQ